MARRRRSQPPGLDCPPPSSGPPLCFVSSARRPLGEPFPGGQAFGEQQAGRAPQGGFDRGRGLARASGSTSGHEMIHRRVTEAGQPGELALGYSRQIYEVAQRAPIPQNHETKSLHLSGWQLSLNVRRRVICPTRCLSSVYRPWRRLLCLSAESRRLQPCPEALLSAPCLHAVAPTRIGRTSHERASIAGAPAPRSGASGR